MKFYSHWARASGSVSTPKGPQMVSALGWSNTDQGSAEELAERRLEALARRLGQGFLARNDYDYGGERPPAEPVLEQLRDATGAVVAVITRNGYGARVLNTERVLFIDVDLEPAAPPRGGFFAALFGKAKSAEQLALERIEEAAHAHPRWAFRVYRTRAGLRLVLLNETLSGFDDGHVAVLDLFGSDPLYQKLCVAQRCFRARLSPKPWRIGLPRPPARFPFASSGERERFDAWLARYELKQAEFSTCQELTTLGLGHPTPVVSAVLAAHDAATLRAGTALA